MRLTMKTLPMMEIPFFVLTEIVKMPKIASVENLKVGKKETVFLTTISNNGITMVMMKETVVLEMDFATAFLTLAMANFGILIDVAILLIEFERENNSRF